MPKQRVLSGMQPSGLLHLGNLMGALDNWRKLQDQYECYYFIADWHALTTNYADTSNIRAHSREMVIDWLAAGLDPEKPPATWDDVVKYSKQIHDKLGIASIDELEKACQAGRIATLDGFGEKTQQNLLDGIARRRTYASRHLLHKAVAVAEPLLEALRHD